MLDSTGGVDGMDATALAQKVQEAQPGGVLKKGGKAKGGGSRAVAAEARRVRERVAEEKAAAAAAAAAKRVQEEKAAEEAERALLEAEAKAVLEAEAKAEAAAQAKMKTGMWHETDYVAEGDPEIAEQIIKHRPRTAEEEASYKLKVQNLTKFIQRPQLGFILNAQDSA